MHVKLTELILHIESPAYHLTLWRKISPNTKAQHANTLSFLSTWKRREDNDLCINALT